MSSRGRLEYSCDGTLLVPIDHDRESGWTERLVSGNRMKIVLALPDQSVSGNSGYLLWGENYRQEKVFEVNLRFVKSYLVRTRTWHEVTASARRRFVLSFEDTEQFAIFYSQLEAALMSLDKFKTAVGETETDSIVVLRVDKIPPKKPPRLFTPDSASTPAGVQHDPPVPLPNNQSLEQKKAAVVKNAVRPTKPVPDSGKKRETTWYTCDYDDLPRDRLTPCQARSKSLGDENPYETIEEEGYEDPAEITAAMKNLRNAVNSAKPRSGGEDTSAPKNQVSASNKGDAISDAGVTDTNAFICSSYGETYVYDNVTYVPYNKPITPLKPKHVQFGFCGSDTTSNNIRQEEHNLSPNDPKHDESSNERRRPYDNATDGVLNQPHANTKETNPIRPNSLPDSPTETPGTTTDRSPVPAPRKVRGNVGATRSPQEENTWTCPLCTLLNNATVNICAACDSPRTGITGATTVNTTDVTANSLHRLPSAYVVPSSVYRSLIADEVSQCSLCATLNNLAAEACRGCSAWTCSHCTLHNHPDSWVCTACSCSRLPA